MKDLSGTNVQAQKELTAYKPTIIVDLEADSPTTAAHKYYGSKKCTISTVDYEDILESVGDIDITMPAGGGLAKVGDCQVAVRNEEGYATILDDYYLENDNIDISLIFRTGSETSADILGLFTGVVDDIDYDWQTFKLKAKDRSFVKDKILPRERMDIVKYPYVPLDNIGKVIPVAFGRLNRGPFADLGKSISLAPCVCLNQYAQQFTAGFNCYSYGDVYVYYESARRHGLIVDITQTGDTFTVNTSKRMIEVAPIRPMATNDVATWYYTADGNSSTGYALQAGDDLDVAFAGCPKLGTAYVVRIDIYATATGTANYTVTNTRSGTTATSTFGGGGLDTYIITLNEAEYAENWDFENLTLELSLATGAVTIWEMVVRVYFYEQESFGVYSLPVFQAVMGYKDTAARYADGAAISGEGTMLENPAHVLEALLRDRRIGLGLLSAQIDLTALDTAATDLTGWKVAFSLGEEEEARDFFDRFARQTKMRLFENYNGKTKAIVFDKTDAPVSTFQADLNIAVENPQSLPQQHRSSIQISRSPMSELANEFEVKYSKDYALNEYIYATISTGHYRTYGSNAYTFPSLLRLVDEGATFLSDGVAAGDYLLIVGDKMYTVTSVVNETTLAIAAVTGAINVIIAGTYYIGPFLNYDCWDSEQKYKTTNTMTVEAEFLNDATTAGYLKTYFLDYYVQRRLVVKFRTWFNACDLEVGDFIFVLDDCLPANKRPKTVDALNGAINNSTITVVVVTGYKFRINDYILIDHEIMKVTNVSGNNLTVTRSVAQTTAMSHLDAAVVYRIETKFEVLGLRVMPQLEDAAIEITAREVPRWYLPVGHWAPDAIPTYQDATDAQRIQYGFWSYENGRVLWYDPETEISHWGT